MKHNFIGLVAHKLRRPHKLSRSQEKGVGLGASNPTLYKLLFLPRLKEPHDRKESV